MPLSIVNMFYDFHIFLSVEKYDILGTVMMTVNKCLPSGVKTENRNKKNCGRKYYKTLKQEKWFLFVYFPLCFDRLLNIFDLFFVCFFSFFYVNRITKMVFWYSFCCSAVRYSDKNMNGWIWFTAKIHFNLFLFLIIHEFVDLHFIEYFFGIHFCLSNWVVKLNLKWALANELKIAN